MKLWGLGPFWIAVTRHRFGMRSAAADVATSRITFEVHGKTFKKRKRFRGYATNKRRKPRRFTHRKKRFAKSQQNRMFPMLNISDHSDSEETGTRQDLANLNAEAKPFWIAVTGHRFGMRRHDVAKKSGIMMPQSQSKTLKKVQTTIKREIVDELAACPAALAL